MSREQKNIYQFLKELISSAQINYMPYYWQNLENVTKEMLRGFLESWLEKCQKWWAGQMLPGFIQSLRWPIIEWRLGATVPSGLFSSGFIKQIVHEHVDKKTVTRPGSIMISEAEAVERVRWAGRKASLRPYTAVCTWANHWTPLSGSTFIREPRP